MAGQTVATKAMWNNAFVSVTSPCRRRAELTTSCLPVLLCLLARHGPRLMSGKSRVLRELHFNAIILLPRLAMISNRSVSIALL